MCVHVGSGVVKQFNSLVSLCGRALVSGSKHKKIGNLFLFTSVCAYLRQLTDWFYRPYCLTHSLI